MTIKDIIKLLPAKKIEQMVELLRKMDIREILSIPFILIGICFLMLGHKIMGTRKEII